MIGQALADYRVTAALGAGPAEPLQLAVGGPALAE